MCQISKGKKELKTRLCINMLGQTIFQDVCYDFFFFFFDILVKDIYKELGNGNSFFNLYLNLYQKKTKQKKDQFWAIFQNTELPLLKVNNVYRFWCIQV